jgi:NtrC-family two-component system sensor histidine kinase KinB
MYVASESAKDISQAAILSMTAVGLLAIGLALAFSFILSDRLINPIRRVHSAAVRIAEGNYDVEVPSDASDELGQLGEQFNVMAARLRTFRDLNVEQIVAEKRKSEAVIRSIDDGIIAVDAELNVIDINPAAAGILGVNIDVTRTCRLEDVIGHNSLFNYVRATLETGRPPDVDERDTFLTLSRHDIKSHYQYAVTPVRTPGGHMLGAIVLFRDVTHLKELDRLKSEFVAMASHELQTPLTSIGMSLGLLQERIMERLSDSERELLKVASEDTARLRCLVRDLLDLSKIEAGKIELAFESVPVHLLLEKAADTLRSQADERSVILSSDAGEDLPSVRADANKVTWVLTNLLSNALRYTSVGGHIRLSALVTEAKVHISVADDGEGIPYVDQPKIFEKFVQVNENAGKGGSGLGLAICKEIVRAHGGSIRVDSTPGAGSTFTFTLPLA